MSWLCSNFSLYNSAAIFLSSWSLVSFVCCTSVTLRSVTASIDLPVIESLDVVLCLLHRIDLLLSIEVRLMFVGHFHQFGGILPQSSRHIVEPDDRQIDRYLTWSVWRAPRGALWIVQLPPSRVLGIWSREIPTKTLRRVWTAGDCYCAIEWPSYWTAPLNPSDSRFYRSSLSSITLSIELWLTCPVDLMWPAECFSTVSLLWLTFLLTLCSEWNATTHIRGSSGLT